MKIQLKKELHENLRIFQESKNDPSLNCFYFHPDYHITYDDRNTLFDVDAIAIQGIGEFFVCSQESPDRFDFLPRKYFDIIDFSVPRTWGIGGFPKGYLSYGRDEENESIDYDNLFYSSEKIYYWGCPVFFSDIDFLNKYYDNRDFYVQIFKDYKGLNIQNDAISTSPLYIDEILGLIHKLP